MAAGLVRAFSSDPEAKPEPAQKPVTIDGNNPDVDLFSR
jgi:hypothetical protein